MVFFIFGGFFVLFVVGGVVIIFFGVVGVIYNVVKEKKVNSKFVDV